MSLSAVIVDDEQLARDELAFLLNELQDVEVVAQGKNGVEAVSLVKEHNPDLLFLDVQMPGLDGFGVIKKLLDKKVALPKIVFATAFDQYAVKAFEVNAVDYLLKPFDRKRVVRSVKGAQQDGIEWCLGRAIGGFGSHVREPEASGAENSAQSGRKNVSRQSEGHLLCLHRGWSHQRSDHRRQRDGGESNCRTLEELLESLDPDLFWRAHRSFLVNINRIKEVVPWFKSSYQLRMDDKKQTEVPVSRAQTKRLRELFGL